MLLARAFVEHYRGMRRISSACRSRLRTVGIETFINSQCVHALPSNRTEVDETQSTKSQRKEGTVSLIVIWRAFAVVVAAILLALAKI
jgi:hypothetical protein